MPAKDAKKPKYSIPPFTRMPPLEERVTMPEIDKTPGMDRCLTGDASFVALQSAVDELKRSAPADSDVIVVALGISVDQVKYVEPHTLILHGYDGDGNRSSVVAHYTQLLARVIYQPKRSPERVITGFSRIGQDQGADSRSASRF